MLSSKAYSARFSAKNLRALYVSKVGLAPSVGLDKITSSHFANYLDENIDILLRKVEKRTYSFTTYRQVLISKGPERAPRVINIPTIRDQLALSALSQVLDDVFEEQVKTPNPQGVVQSIVGELSRAAYESFVKVDIKQFYGSIPHDRLMKRIRRKIRKPQMLDMLERALTTPSASFQPHSNSTRRACGVPEGLSISNKLGNLYLSDADEAMRTYGGIAYFRYVDDILILCPKDATAKIELYLSKQMKRLRLQTSEAKCSKGDLADRSFEYLGYVFLPDGRVSVRKQSLFNLESALESHVKQYRNSKNKSLWLWQLNLRITGCRISEDSYSFERFGWLHYFSKINDVELVCHLDWLVKRLLYRHKVNLKNNELKTFKKTYYEVKYNSGYSNYIPCYVNGESVAEKRKMLKTLFQMVDIDDLDDAEIEELFNRHVRKEARKLERDIGMLS